MTKFQLITKGLVKDNPTFVLILGMWPLKHQPSTVSAWDLRRFSC